MLVIMKTYGNYRIKNRQRISEDQRLIREENLNFSVIFLEFSN